VNDAALSMRARISCWMNWIAHWSIVATAS
jgi:hypothetical protein